MMSAYSMAEVTNVTKTEKTKFEKAIAACTNDANCDSCIAHNTALCVKVATWIMLRRNNLTAER